MEMTLLPYFDKKGGRDIDLVAAEPAEFMEA